MRKRLPSSNRKLSNEQFLSKSARGSGSGGKGEGFAIPGHAREIGREPEEDQRKPLSGSKIRIELEQISYHEIPAAFLHTWQAGNSTNPNSCRLGRMSCIMNFGHLNLAFDIFDFASLKGLRH